MQKDPVCGMMVDEKKPGYNQPIKERTSTSVPAHAKQPSTKPLRNTQASNLQSRLWLAVQAKLGFPNCREGP